MSVGIITFHCSYNFGSALQSFAMQAAVQRLGYAASLIDYRSKDFEQYRLVQFKHPKSFIRFCTRPASYLKRRNAFHSFWKRFFNLTNKYNDKTIYRMDELASEFDCFVCGSDQIWNLDCTNGIVKPFFLSFAGDRRRVAYAPSLAHTSFKPENFDKRSASALLSRFDYLSVREEETVSLFQSLVDKPIEVVLDPTLLLNADDYAVMTSRKLLEDGYIFMYLLRECPELVESTVLMATSTGRKVAYISEKNLDIPNSVNLFGVGPEEFVSLIAHASLVLTNSFHATVFSVLFHKPFRVFATDKSGARMRDLLGNIGLSSRCANAICADDIVPCDWDDVDSRLDSLREHSWSYLRKALS